MNILVISSLFPSLHDSLSGIFVQAQVRELVKQSCQVKVISPVPWAPFPINLLSKKWAGFHNSPSSARMENIEIFYPRFLSLPRNWFFANSGKRMFVGISKLAAEIVRDFQPDLIHAHVALPDGYAAMEIARQFKVPYLVTIHGADLQQTIHLGHRSKEAIKQVLQNSSAIIFVSKKLKRIAKEQFGNVGNLTVIANGINPSDLPVDSLESPVIERDQQIILSVSNLIASKGIDLNLIALKRIQNDYPNLKYQIVGDGPERKNLEAFTKELGLSERVEFLGKMSHDQVLRTMANCDIFSLPSWQEGFGIVYLEAMGLAKPVIGCLGEGIEDFVEHGEVGFLVNPRDPSDLVKILKDLLDHPHKRVDIGFNAQAKVLEQFTWEINAQKVISLYQKLGKLNN